MNRLISLFLAAGGLVVFPLVDSAIKGTIVLLLAGFVCLALRRDSAATRHFVWTMAICLLIAMPFLSLVLPEWQVLPSWMNSDEPTVATSSPTFVAPLDSSPATPEIADLSPAMPLPGSYVSEDSELVQATTIDPEFQPVQTMMPNPAESVDTERSPIQWTTWLSGIWFFGCVLLILRLLAAAVLLRRAARRSVIVTSVFGERLGVSPPCHTLADAVILASGTRQLPGTTSLQSPASSPANPSYRPADTGRSPMFGFRRTTRRADAQPLAVTDVETQRLQTALNQATALLGVKRPIQLLLDPTRAIPIVWGLLKTRLQLPAEAVHWTDEQLQSVLLHELAHVRRRDLFVLAITQLACSLHWFNPLVWIAAWRMHVERERACDDLVLASGVRASAYAEHLLTVATRLSSSKWTQACGLAMARSSSLHGRLTAVLSEKTNRRNVTKVIASISLLIGCAAAVPIAMLQAAIDQPDEQRVTDPKTTDSTSNEDQSVNSFPYTNWQEWPNTPPIPVFAFCTDVWINFHEQHLDWSKPVNGLRAALMIKDTKEKGILGHKRQIFLVIQNVSDQPIRFCDTGIEETDIPAADVEGRKLYLNNDGKIMFALQNTKSTNTDLVLQPHHIHFVDMFDSERAGEEGRITGDLLAAGIVKVPTQSLSAVLNIVHSPEGTWTGKLKTPATRGAFAAYGPMPTSTEAQTLFRHCMDHARLNGKIPGGIINRLHDLVQEFIRNNSGDEYGDEHAKKMRPLVARFDHKGDWKQRDVSKLFDDIAAVSTIPLERTMDIIRENTLQRGQQLPTSLNDANWGEALPGGLRIAWLLEPRKENYHLGSALTSHIVIHNSGNEAVMFVTRSFHQPEHTAVTADRDMVRMESTDWTTRGRPEPFRLRPGEYCEVHAPGIGIGPPNKDLEDWSNVRAGSWILANDDQNVIFQPGEILLTGDHNGKVGPDWWLKFITERINDEAPLPDDATEREAILFRVISDLFGSSPTPEEAAAFLADTSPQAVDHLVKMLSERTWHTSVAGPIKSGEIKFNVLPEDPDAATRPRIATNPGRYNLGDEIRFVVTRRAVGERIINEADIVWYPPGQDNVPTKVPLPDGYDTWAAGWLPKTTILWVSQPGLLRSYDFTYHAASKETRYEGDQITTAPIPADVREALRTAMEKASVPNPQQPPGPPAATEDDSASVKEPSDSRKLNMIHGRLLKPDDTPAVGFLVNADDGFDRFEIVTKSPGDKLPAEPSEKAMADTTKILNSATSGGEYDLGNGRILRIDTRNETKQSFTVIWKETSESSGYQLNVVPKLSADVARIRMAPRAPGPAGADRPTIGWSVAWESGSSSLWIEESGLISKLDIANPEQVVRTQHDRSGTYSSPEIPDDVREKFHASGDFESRIRLLVWPRIIAPNPKPATVQTLTATKITR